MVALCPTWLSEQYDATSFKCQRLVINWGVGGKKTLASLELMCFTMHSLNRGTDQRAKTTCTEDASEGFTSSRLGPEEEKKSRKK